MNAFKIAATSLALAITLAAAADAGGHKPQTKTFHTPMVHGQEIDTRYKRHEAPRPKYVANLICQSQGYAWAMDWGTKSYRSTRTWGGGKVMKAMHGKHPKGFSWVKCSF